MANSYRPEAKRYSVNNSATVKEALMCIFNYSTAQQSTVVSRLTKFDDDFGSQIKVGRLVLELDYAKTRQDRPRA